ncbi:glutamate-5-semialdehyde dehydrogenase [Christensenella sp. MSJ-20]|uniref:glutamate-5-semialdehyde dehydrogenase n=1 Tax=Christensenella sp. MSJ-20 TaxID=2841518 RepID=UPI0037C00B56
MELTAMGKAAKAAALRLNTLGTQAKDRVLSAMAQALMDHMEEILAANALDMEAAGENGVPPVMLDRLRLDEARVAAMAQGLRDVIALPDPTSETDYMVERPNGLNIGKRRVPLGVIGIIFEARPNVTADAIGLCVKSGNACILRGGKEAIHSNLAIAGVMDRAAQAAGYPEGGIQILSDTSREAAQEMMRMNGYIDVLIPRGGAGLIQSVVQNATVPVIETGVGVCHTFVDASADLPMAAEIAVNAKVSRPSVCNSMETLLVHRDVADVFLPMVFPMLEERNVELRCCARSLPYAQKGVAAIPENYDTEYNDLILNVKVVDGLPEAVEHINAHGTRHSEAIVTRDYDSAQTFLAAVDAAAVYVNASTRFTDGGEFGLGAEIGISTQKLHARGPMGLKELTTYKYVIYGQGQIR